MRLVKHALPKIEEADLTPMIDMTFQLIAFFMVLINFSDAEQDQRINLPASELAKPPDEPFEEPLTIHLTRESTAVFQGDEVPIAGLRTLLLRERQVLERFPDKSPDMVTVIIRGDAAAQTGHVQQIIDMCQDLGFETFALRLRQRDSTEP
jgi:biopolymer transport protein ExbD